MSGLDQHNRLLAIDPTQSFCVSAPAGSGKTELLTQRLLALLTRVSRPEQVLAITFTRKAASEMASRVIEKLEEARHSAPIRFPHESTTRELALSLLSHAHRLDWQLDQSTLNIRTIDSFCHEITRRMPIVSGVGGVSEPRDDATELYERAVAQFLAQTGDQGAVGDALRLLLSQFDNRWVRVRELLVSLLERRGDWAPHIGQHHDPAGTEAILIDSVSNLVCHRLSATRDRLGAQFAELSDVLNEARTVMALAPLELTVDEGCLEDWRTMVSMLLTTAGDWRKPGGVSIRQGFEKGSEAKRRFVALLADISGDEQLCDYLNEIKHLPSLQRNRRDWQLVVTLSTLLPVLQAHLLLVFQQASAVDHTHIALAACDALGPDDKPSPVAERFDFQIEHILVDEFQDTAHSQAELLRRLTRDWAAHNASAEMPRTLFVVGDAMQSIYGFRYADVALFMRVAATGLSGLKLIPLTLTQNFRSRPVIVKWVNDVFAALMGAEEDLNKGSVRHVTAIATREAADPAALEGVHIDLFDENPLSAESERIAMRIEELRGTDPEASIAILVRAKSHATEIVSALVARGIVFDGDALQSLAEQAIVQDLLSLCRWLENPAENVAALALMRSPWVGLSLNSLATLLADRAGKSFNLLEIIDADCAMWLPEEERHRLSTLISTLRWANRMRDRLALPVWIEQIWLRLKGPVTALPEELPSVRLFFEALRSAEAAGVGLNTKRIISDLSSISLDRSESSGSVRVLTLHKAKGLEFDYVFLPALQKQPRANSRELLRWHWHEGAASRSLLIAADDQEKLAPTLYNYLNWLQKAKQQEELKRLLYVGVTRAREGVFLSGTVKTLESEGEVTAPTGALLSLLETKIKAATRNQVTPEPASSAQSADGLINGLEAKSPLYRIARDALPQHVESYSDRISEHTIQPEVNADRLGLYNRRERVLGVITHRILERLATQSPLPLEITDEITTWIRANILKANLDKPDAERIETECSEMITNALQCPMGRWILSIHPEAYSELEITRIEDGEVRHYVIDRTFFDEKEGVRWIVDYKTSSPKTEEDEESFKSRELMNYRAQLDTYTDLLKNYRGVEDAPIRTALYFPAIQALALG